MRQRGEKERRKKKIHYTSRRQGEGRVEVREGTRGHEVKRERERERENVCVSLSLSIQDGKFQALFENIHD